MSKLKEIKRPKSVSEKAYRYQMGLLGERSGLSFATSSCKEEVYTMVGKAIGFDYDADFMSDALGANFVSEPIDVENPGIIIYLRPNKRFTSARRINRVVRLLSKRQKLKAPKVYLYKDTAAALIRVDKWYYCSPVATSGLLTFIRAAARTDFVFNTLENFISKAGRSNTFGDGLAGDDSCHIEVAQKNGNLEGFLDKTLTTLKYRNGKAWRIGKNTDIPYDGIVGYDATEKVYRDISNGILVDNDDDDDDYWDEPCSCPECRLLRD